MFIGLTASCQAYKQGSGLSTIPGHEQKLAMLKVSACRKKQQITYLAVTVEEEVS